MKKNFFRQDATSHFYGETYSSASPIRPLTPTPVLFSLVALFLAGLVLISIVPYSIKTNASGILESSKGLARVYPRSAGVVSVRLVEQGDYVEKGQQLFSVDIGHYSGLDDRGTDISLRVLEEQKHELTQQIEIHKARVALDQDQINNKIKGEQLKYSAAVKRTDLSENKIRILQNQKDAAKKLLDQDMLSRRSYGDYQIAIIEAEHEYSLAVHDSESAQLTMTELDNDLDILQASSELTLSELRYQLEAIEQSVAQARANASYEIFSPVSGKVVGMQGHAGMTVSEKISIGTILPDDSSLIAKIYIPAESIGFLEEGDEVRLSYTAFPKKHYGFFRAHLTSIGKTLYQSSELATSIQLPDGHYYLANAKIPKETIEINGQEIYLQPDMAFDAVIVLDTKPIIQWALSPLRSSIKNL